MRSILLTLLAALTLPVSAAGPALFEKDNLVAWCIVPFDAKKRSPEQRASMLEALGIKRLAYDYRAEHIPQWDEELAALKRHGIELTAWWFPSTLNDEALAALALFKRHGVTPQLWVTGGGGPVKDDAEQNARIASEAARIGTIANAAAATGCKVALYNHGGWYGEPENQLAIIAHLARDGITNVGIVYNFHHGHQHLDRFAALLDQMKPRLLAINLNGMTRDGDTTGKKILVLGDGEMDLGLLRILAASDWRGPVGILNHTDGDAEARLKANLDGLRKLSSALEPRAPAK